MPLLTAQLRELFSSLTYEQMREVVFTEYLHEMSRRVDDDKSFDSQVEGEKR